MRRTQASTGSAAALIALASLGAHASCTPRASPSRAAPAPAVAPATSAVARSGAEGDTPGPAAPHGQPNAPSPGRALSFLENDFQGALSKARTEHKLLFVDVWAPWCHTCLAMRQHVLGRPELGRFAEGYVFAALDSDRPESAPFLERYRVEAWPTMFLIQPRSGAVVGMHAGSASLPEVAALLEAGLQEDVSPLAVALAMGHASFAAGNMPGAVESYTMALGASSPRLRAQARLGAIRALFELEDFPRCTELGVTEGAGLDGSSAPIDFAFYAFECASHLPPGPVQADAVRRLRARIEGLVAHPPEGASNDDLGDLYALAARAVRASGDAVAARSLEERGLALLEQSAAAAATAEAAQVHDYARMNAYLALGRGAEALGMLEERCRQLPDRYEPFARLASTLGELGRPTEALTPLRRAIELSYGPRRLRYLAKLAALLEKTGDRDASLGALREEVQGWERLPEGQRSAESLADARQRLGKAEAALARPGGPAAVTR